MYLSRLLLEPRSLAVRRDLADAQLLHACVMRAFPERQAADADRVADARHQFGVLYRLDRGPRQLIPMLLVQSKLAPDWIKLPAGYLAAVEGENPATKEIDASLATLRPGQRLMFRLRANATKKVGTALDATGNRGNGRRIPVYLETSPTKKDERSPTYVEDALEAWLARKGTQGGFRPLSVRVRAEADDWHGYRTDPHQAPDAANGSKQRLTFAGALFEGELLVTDADALRATVAAGIGPAKAYGFGLLSLAPA